MSETSRAEQILFNHVGICVGDIERSARFYTEALGFRRWWELEPPDEATSRLLGLAPPLGLEAVYLVRDRFVLELLHFADAGTTPADGRVMNTPGLTHISLAVGDIPAMKAAVVANGGSVLEETDLGGVAVMIRDPDGQLIELTSLRFNQSRPAWPE
jgi:lactoylglutathione lyase